MSPGDTIEAAIWLSGEEITEDLSRFTSDVKAALDQKALAERAVLAPPQATTKYPGQDRVPLVPDHIQGPDVRLLVIEAVVLEVRPIPGHFLNELDPRDLARLRRVTRKAHARQFPGQSAPTDRQCDALINDLGPESAMAALERGSATIQ